MMKTAALCFTLFWLASAACHAGVSVHTNIREVWYDLNAQQLGAVTLTIDANDFNTASPSTPIYIAAQLDHDVVLCQTLVGPKQPAPIFLPMRLEGDRPTDHIAAAPNTAAIVRWIAGEDQIWIRIQSSSSTWIQTAAGLAPPAPGRPISITLGASARGSDQNHISSAEDPNQYNANLPYATRVPGAAPNPESATSTLFCVDLSGSNLEEDPQHEPLPMINWDLTAWTGSQNVRTAPHPTQIDRGMPWAATFIQNTPVERGTAIDACSVLVTPTFARRLDEGALALAANIDTTCPVGFNTGSYLEVGASQAQTGFPLFLDQDGNPVLENGRYLVQPDALMVAGQSWTPPTADPADVLFLSGVPAAATARITYAERGVDGSFNFSFQATLISEAPIAPVMLQVAAGQTARDSAFVSNPEPYTGAHQHDSCSGPAQRWSQDVTLTP